MDASLFVDNALKEEFVPKGGWTFLVVCNYFGDVCLGGGVGIGLVLL